MRPEVREKLDAAERLHHGRGALVGMLVFSMMLWAIWVMPWWTGNEQNAIYGVVRFATRTVDPDTGQRGMTLQVGLPDGRLVNAESFPIVAQVPPAVGSTVRLTERRSFTGYHSYVWAPPQ